MPWEAKFGQKKACSGSRLNPILWEIGGDRNNYSAVHHILQTKFYENRYVFSE
jgi:hypothetical protein